MQQATSPENREKMRSKLIKVTDEQLQWLRERKAKTGLDGNATIVVLINQAMEEEREKQRAN